MENNYIIELKNVSKIFDDDTVAVDNFNLYVRKGEFITFLGPSGCGKSTTLRMIAGFDFPSKGEILLNGKDISNLPPNKRPINMVFQRYALFSHLDVYDNIAFGLRLKKIPVVKKDKDGNFVKVDLTEKGGLVKNGPVKIVATNDKARVDGNDQWFVIGAIEVNKDATLRLNKVRTTIATETSVSMFGEKDHEADLIINSNATLTVEGNVNKAIKVKGDRNYNTISNESTGTNISF